MTRYRVAASVGAILVVLALAWIAGFDFGERGPVALIVAIWAIFAGASAWVVTLFLEMHRKTQRTP